VPLSQQLGDEGARSAPATAVALLLHERLEVQKWGEPCQARQRGPDKVRATNKHHSLIVVKLGGSLLADPQQWRAALSTLTSAAKSYRLVIVPGGGPFADVVRSIDERFRLSDDAAHIIFAQDRTVELVSHKIPVTWAV